ncbi:MAG: DNA polymerase III subunit gamma/tau [Gammaproteobacteria bacterium]|nr:DNA polymerase III subunit gamma/tau [Gammaproteobacteria bacterium]
MNYQVLARKWRPKIFPEVVGQKHVTQALINALERQRLHHAYLFTGTRGVGKTTLARIFAKCLNCETGVTATPCGTCSACQEIDTGRFVDLIEVDAASRTKVEDTRELLDNVQYAPTRGRYKIYLIDEVHMLSGHSFNALLKTLEEPPPHVKFLLATTDPQKLPITVLSRCLQFNLKNLAPEKIAGHLVSILQQENISYEVPALEHLARAADGSVRDGLSLLDQAIAYGNNTVAAADVSKMLGAIENVHIYALLTALLEKNADEILNKINELSEQSADFATALESLLTTLHQLAVIQMVPDVDYYNANELREIAALFTPEDVQLYYQIALIGRRDLAFAPTAKQGFEMIMLRMLAFQPVTQAQDSVPTKKSGKPAPAQVQAPISAPENINIPIPANAAEWKDLLPRLNISESTRALAAHCNMQEIKDNSVQLLLSDKYAPILNGRHIERLTKSFSELFNKPMRVVIDISKAVTNTPSELVSREQESKLQQAEVAITQNTNVQAIKETFNASVVPGSVININHETERK